jgi:glycosyltransferase involved in cell wall biosynthesis
MVNPYDTRELKLALRELLFDTLARRRLAERGVAHARLFSWQRTAQQTVEAYYQTQGRRIPPRADHLEMSSSIEIRDG